MCPVPGVQIPGWQTLSCLFPFWGRPGVPGGQGDAGASTVTCGHLGILLWVLPTSSVEAVGVECRRGTLSRLPAGAAERDRVLPV